MVRSVDSTPAPAAHGPVTLALRALAAEHGPRPSNVISLASARPPRMPSFSPLDFSFPLDDATWAKVHLQPVRFAADFVNHNGRAAVNVVLTARSQSASVVEATERHFARTIDELETLAELMRTGLARLREANAVAVRIETAEAAR